MLDGPHIDVVGLDVLFLALVMIYRQLLREK